MSRKSKGILVGIAAMALIIAGISSLNFSHSSVEDYTQQTAQVVDLTGQNLVYWTEHGKYFHIYDDCSQIDAGTNEILEGTVAQARELKKIGLCEACENRAEKAKKLNATGQKSIELGTESEHEYTEID